jgi:predicted Zn-dependent peptidase
MYYVPNNATLSIAGDFTPEQAKRWIEAYFGPIAKGKDIVRPTFQPEPKGEVRDVIKVKDQLPLMVQAYRIPAQGTPEFYAVDMLNTLLSNGTSSRLNKSIVEEKELAIFSGAFTFNLEDPGLTLSYTVANMGVDTQELEKAVNDEFVRLQNEPITDAEFQKLRNQIESNFISSNSSMAGIAESLANYHTYYGETNLINTEIERYMKVTKEDLMAAAKKYYTPDNRVTLFFEHDPSLLEK